MNLIDELLPNMRRVQAADRDLKDLGLLWTMIEASASISSPVDAQSILPTLTETRERFADLQVRLIHQLGREGLAELSDELASTAQCSIDILVRNLFERTADVGFLATDDSLRDFCALSGEERTAARPALAARLAAYRDKYSVYDDIVVLGLDGQVLARLDEGSGLATSHDAVVAQALASTAYVERFGASDLAPTPAPALLYAHRIDSVAGQKLGVLVLRFRLADELRRIFEDTARAQRQLCVVMLDDADRVVASNDEAHVPLQALMKPGPAGQVALVQFAGCEYLAQLCTTRGYQGYGGPGWRAMAMVALNTAFRARADAAADLQGVSLDNAELRRIQLEVDTINRNLRRVVWNGRLVADSNVDARQNLKALLHQVNETGSRMRDRTGQAIGDLYRTALGRARLQAAELARLAADIMDRNLYERANDCRWWALSPVLQGVLSSPVDAEGTQRLNRVLQVINGLYTVYTRLMVFDAEGRICGLSHDDPTHSLLGTQMPPGLLQATRGLVDAQRYAVSPFEASPINSQVPTYTYLAAVRDTTGQRMLGGIAIVFNAEREFRAMLSDVLQDRAGLAAFVDSSGRIVSCSDAGHAPFSSLPFPAEPGVVEHDGAHYAVACVAATGYREFKHQDGYDNGIRSVVALRLGALERRRKALFDIGLRALPHRPQRARADTAADPAAATRQAAGQAGGAQRPAVNELAVFQVGAARYALPVSSVLEARPQQGLVRVARAGAHLAGLIDVQPEAHGQLLTVYCARSLFGVTYPARESDGIVLVLADPAVPGQPLLGLRVDDLICVLDVDASHVQAAPEGLRRRAPWLTGMVRALRTDVDSGEAIIELLDAGALTQMLRGGQALQAA